MSLAQRITKAPSAGGLNVTSEAAIPDINNLLIAKMLGEVGAYDNKGDEIKNALNPFKNLQWEETKYLRAARNLLQQNAILSLRLGGSGLEQSIRLAGQLKGRAEQLFLNDQIDLSAHALVKESMNENYQLGGLASAAVITEAAMLDKDSAERVRTFYSKYSGTDVADTARVAAFTTKLSETG